MNQNINIHWFRQDLRLNDNPSLFNAAKNSNLLPIYIYDNKNQEKFHIGNASKVWLYYSLKSLNNSLDGKLHVYIGDPKKILFELIKTNEVKNVYWNECYELWRINSDNQIKNILHKQGVTVKTYNGSLLWDPKKIMKNNQTPYKIFTHYYRKANQISHNPRNLFPIPNKLDIVNLKIHKNNIEDLGLLPKSKWYKSVISNWNIGEKEAQNKLTNFTYKKINKYKMFRNYPSRQYTSLLSPHLHFGEISPNQIWHSIKKLDIDENISQFFSQLGWREFSYYLLFHNPYMPEKNIQTKFNSFPWNKNDKFFNKWKKGITGIPIIDAAMRELWKTGYMHNRMRMITASFLVKNLLIHWKHGELWFWDCLLDADLANNSSGWQWVAGSGADASPYFRIFNPITQSQKFDPQGIYIRKYIPELKKLDTKYLFKPWEAPITELKKANIILGTTYPKPIIDLKYSYQRAMNSFKSLKYNSIKD